MIVWNYRVSYENNLQGTDEIEQILRTFHNIFGLLLHLCLDLRLPANEKLIYCRKKCAAKFTRYGKLVGAIENPKASADNQKYHEDFLILLNEIDAEAIKYCNDSIK